MTSYRLLQANETEIPLNVTQPADVEGIVGASLVLVIVLPIVGASALAIFITCCCLRRLRSNKESVRPIDIEAPPVNTMSDLIQDDFTLQNQTKYRKYGEKTCSMAPKPVVADEENI